MFVDYLIRLEYYMNKESYRFLCLVYRSR